MPRIDWEQLVANLDGNRDLARRTVEGFLLAAVRAVPTGKQTSFAAQNPPDFLLGVVRQDGASWSLANAFETPIPPARQGGYLVPSIQALDAYWGMLMKVYGNGQITPVALSTDGGEFLDTLKDACVENMDQWISKLAAALPQE